MTLRIRWSRSVFIVPLLLVATRKASAETTNFRVQGNTATALPEAGRSSRPLFGKLRLCRASDLVDKVLPGGRTPDAGTLLQVNKTDICSDVVLFEGGGEYQVCLTATRMHRVTIVTAQIREDLFTCIAELS
jgi:hypothetical protein